MARIGKKPTKAQRQREYKDAFEEYVRLCDEAAYRELSPRELAGCRHALGVIEAGYPL
jgi:hypothetical protein